MLTRATLRRFGVGTAAVAAVEFAMLFPVLLLLYIAAAEISDAVITGRKLSAIAYMATDVLGQQASADQPLSTPLPPTALPSQVLDGLVTATQKMLLPKSPAPFAITISALDVVNQKSGKCCAATIRWSYTSNGVLRPCETPLRGSDATDLSESEIPVSLLPSGTPLSHPIYYVVVDVKYVYQPPISAGFVFSPTMKRVGYARPRDGGQLAVMSLPSKGVNHGKVCY